MFNLVVLVGNLAKDAEIRTSQSEIKSAHMRLILNEDVLDKASGNWVNRSSGINCRIYGRYVKYAEKAARKGNLFLVEGKLKTFSYMHEGQKMHGCELLVTEQRGSIQNLSPRQNGDGRHMSDHGNGDHTYEDLLDREDA